MSILENLFIVKLKLFIHPFEVEENYKKIIKKRKILKIFFSLHLMVRKMKKKLSSYTKIIFKLKF